MCECKEIRIEGCVSALGDHRNEYVLQEKEIRELIKTKLEIGQQSDSVFSYCKGHRGMRQLIA